MPNEAKLPRFAYLVRRFAGHWVRVETMLGSIYDPVYVEQATEPELHLGLPGRHSGVVGVLIAIADIAFIDFAAPPGQAGQAMHPAHTPKFDVATPEGRAICDLYRRITDESGWDWGSDTLGVLAGWLTSLGFDTDEPYHAGRTATRGNDDVDATVPDTDAASTPLCPGSGEFIRTNIPAEGGGLEAQCDYCGRTMLTNDLDYFPDHEPPPDEEKAAGR